MLRHTRVTIPDRRQRCHHVFVLSTPLTDLLQEEGLLDDAGLARVLERTERWGGTLIDHLIELGLADGPALAEMIASRLALPLVDLDSAELAQDRLEERLAEQWRAVRLAGGKIAVADPLDPALEELGGEQAI